ncbi:hypothetical protein GCM10009603_57320 [Nocardiopsis exhalans]
MRGFRKQRTASGAGYGHLGFPRANTTALNPILATGCFDGTHDRPRHVARSAQSWGNWDLRCRFSLPALTGRDTARCWAQGWGGLRPKAEVVAVGPLWGPLATPDHTSPVSRQPPTAVAAKRVKVERPERSEDERP